MKGVSLFPSVWGKRVPDRIASAKVLRWEYICARETTKDASVTGTGRVGGKARVVGNQAEKSEEVGSHDVYGFVGQGTLVTFSLS